MYNLNKNMASHQVYLIYKTRCKSLLTSVISVYNSLLTSVISLYNVTIGFTLTYQVTYTYHIYFMNRLMDGLIEGEGMNEWIYGLIKGWSDNQKNGWTVGQINERMDK